MTHVDWRTGYDEEISLINQARERRDVLSREMNFLDRFIAALNASIKAKKDADQHSEGQK